MREPSGDARSLPESGRRLELTIANPESLRAEYARNLHKGGAFVATEARFEMREVVEVLLRLPFVDFELPLPAEVVLCLPPGVAPKGAEPGVAVQFLGDVEAIRTQLEPYLNAATPSQPAAPPPPAPEDHGFGEDAASADLAAAQSVVLGLRADDPDDEPDDSEELLDFGLSQDEGALDLDADLDLLGESRADPVASSPEPEPEPETPTWEPAPALELEQVVEESPPEPVPEPPSPRATSSPFHDERRDSPREVARIRVRVRTATGTELEARTRDLSRSGVLLSVEGAELPLGRRVSLLLTHPAHGTQLEIDGRVVRHLPGEGTVPAVAIRFDPGLGRAAEVTRFIEEVQRIEETRRREGIRGPIEEMGVASLLQMFASCGPRGTVTLTRGTEEGTIAFENGQLLVAQLGPVTGTKALARLLLWEEGEFEFRNHVDPGPYDQSAMSLEAALLDGLRRIDEEKQLQLPQLPPEASLDVDRERLTWVDSPLSKTEEAVLELATAGFTVRRIFDVIPETDAEIRAALATLVERGVLTQRAS